MNAIRRVLIAIAVLMAIAGLVLSLLPYDATMQGPALAGQPGRDVTVPCQAPLVDLVSNGSDDAWLTYTPNEGLIYDSDSRAGGDFCSNTMQTRGITGLVLLMAAACAALASFIGRGRRRKDAEPETGTGSVVSTGGADDRPDQSDGPTPSP